MNHLIQKLSKVQPNMALSNVQLVERTAGLYFNTIPDYIGNLNARSAVAPIFPAGPIPFAVPTADAITFFSNEFNDKDVYAVIAFNTINPAVYTAQRPDAVYLAGLLLKENYFNFSQGKDHDLVMLAYTAGPSPAVIPQLTRRITVKPLSGVNSQIDYSILPIIEAASVRHTPDVAISATANISTFHLNNSLKQFSLSAWPMSLDCDAEEQLTNAIGYCVIVLKGMATYLNSDPSLRKAVFQVDAIFDGPQAPNVIHNIYSGKVRS